MNMDNQEWSVLSPGIWDGTKQLNKQIPNKRDRCQEYSIKLTLLDKEGY